MVFVACGLNHKTAPVSVREKLALTPETQHDVLQHLLAIPAISEAAVLSTCNRTEVYCETDNIKAIVPAIADYHAIDETMISPYAYLHHEKEGLRHLIRVASGLDSMMIGEPQILGQVKKAYHQALEVGSIGPQLRYLFEYLFNASKKIRTHSGIGINPVSVAYAAVNLIGEVFPNYDDLTVFLIGSGETSTLVASYLIKKGVKDFLVASRTLENANQLAQSINGKGLAIGDIPDYLSQADVIISATACPLPFINTSLVERALTKRRFNPMFFLDLAVPRDIEPSVSEIPDVFLYNVDDLQTMIDEGLTQRQHAAEIAEQMIESELENYISWHRSLRANDAICCYREKVSDLANQELNRSLKKLKSSDDAEEILRELTHRLVNKFCHTPSLGLRQAAYDNREDLLQLANYLFTQHP